MNRRATVLISKKETNGAVTNMYMATIGQMLKKDGINLN